MKGTISYFQNLLVSLTDNWIAWAKRQAQNNINKKFYKATFLLLASKDTDSLLTTLSSIKRNNLVSNSGKLVAVQGNKGWNSGSWEIHLVICTRINESHLRFSSHFYEGISQFCSSSDSATISRLREDYHWESYQSPCLLKKPSKPQKRNPLPFYHLPAHSKLKDIFKKEKKRKKKFAMKVLQKDFRWVTSIPQMRSFQFHGTTTFHAAET